MTTATPSRAKPAKREAPATPWDICAKEQLTRPNTNPLYEALDPGVNFFVLALEALGGRPRFSCEGHPCGFYVAFEGTYELAQEIHGAGFFSISIEGPNYWSIRKNEIGSDGAYSESDKARCLRWASEAWVKRFGGRLGALLEQI